MPKQTVQLLGNISQIEITSKEIAKYFKPGLLVAFIGHLGAGKTTLIRKILELEGIVEKTASPTFAYLKRFKRTYDGQIFYHADLYRVCSLLALEELGIAEAISEEGAIALVEWPDLVLANLDPDKSLLIVKIKHLSDTKRFIDLEYRSK